MQRSESILSLYGAASSLRALDLASSVDYMGGIGTLVYVGKAPTRLSARGPITEDDVPIRLSQSPIHPSVAVPAMYLTSAGEEQGELAQAPPLLALATAVKEEAEEEVLLAASAAAPAVGALLAAPGGLGPSHLLGDDGGGGGGGGDDDDDDDLGDADSNDSNDVRVEAL